MEKTCNCAVSSFVLAGDDRVRCRACNRPITGKSTGPATGGAHASGGAFSALGTLDA